MNLMPHDRSSARSSPGGKTLAAVDLGAESCRVSLLKWIDSRPEMQLVYRFPNAPRQGENGLRWDIHRICEGVEEGLRRCAACTSGEIASVGVDGWAVDYVRLGPDGEPVANPFCYRDERTTKVLKNFDRFIPADRLYALTGIQILPLNTLYQLCADESRQQTLPWLNLPEYVLYHLGGKRVAEFTNASNTQLLGVHDQAWCGEIFTATGLDVTAAPPVVKPGTDIGRMTGPLATLPAFRSTRLIAPACHDTASAIAGIPADGDDWAFISSGTWSLVGCVVDSPHVGDDARRMNFSNEGGVGGKIYLLKNVNGMWLLQQCMEDWRAGGHTWKVEDLLAACVTLPPPQDLLDVDDSDLVLPSGMPARISAQLARNGKRPVPVSADAAPQMANLIFHSLAARYAAVLRSIAEITNKSLKRLYVVGGGSRNALLNRLTAEATGLEVLKGSTESTTVGNFAIQLAALESGDAGGAGVSASRVAEWAGRLAGQAIETVSEVQSAITQ